MSASTNAFHPGGPEHAQQLDRARRWAATNTFSAAAFDVADLAARRDRSVSVVLPARRVATTIGSIVREAVRLKQERLVDEVLVIDAGSEDGTAKIAAAAGAEVIHRDGLVEELGPSLGKGDALWRSLHRASGEIVVFVDTDTQNFGPHFIAGLLGPLIEDDAFAFAKGAFRRPLLRRDVELPEEGGRVTQLVARPLLNMVAPQLTGFIQPLAGEVAIRREIAREIPFPVGYGVEVAMLLAVERDVGLERMVQVDLGERRDSSQRLAHLTPMAYSVAETILGTTADTSVQLQTALPTGIQRSQVYMIERPPLAQYEREKATGGTNGAAATA